jgi:hypothetical protein
MNTGIGSYFHYDSLGRPTSLNGITDEIMAWFDFPSGFNVSWLKQLYVEVDVQPACASCQCIYNPYNSTNSDYLNIASQTGGSKTPVGIHIFHIPDESCGNDTIGTVAPCYIPKNRVCIYHKIANIVVQCPGCRISGLYTIRANGSRMNFGFEDNNNDGIADAPLNRIMFNQVRFSPEVSNPFCSPDVYSIMYHDIFRVRHTSIVHLDDVISTNYYPTATRLGLPVSTTTHHAHEKGYSLGYIRVRTSDSIEVFNYKNPADSIHIQKNIPALIVWVMDGDVLDSTSYPYRSGFNALHPNISRFPYQTYSLSPSKTDTVTPIMLFFDPTRDFRDAAKKEFVYDFSWNRLDSAYQQQYAAFSLGHLPFDMYHDKMKFYFDLMEHQEVRYK